MRCKKKLNSEHYSGLWLHLFLCSWLVNSTCCRHFLKCILFSLNIHFLHFVYLVFCSSIWMWIFILILMQFLLVNYAFNKQENQIKVNGVVCFENKACKQFSTASAKRPEQHRYCKIAVITTALQNMKCVLAYFVPHPSNSPVLIKNGQTIVVLIPSFPADNSSRATDSAKPTAANLLAQ